MRSDKCNFREAVEFRNAASGGGVKEYGDGFSDHRIVALTGV
jgi:hypothetical protein